MAKDIELTYPGITLSITKQPMWNPPSEQAYKDYRIREAVMCFQLIRAPRSRKLQMDDTLFSAETWRVANEMAKANPV